MNSFYRKSLKKQIKFWLKNIKSIHLIKMTKFKVPLNNKNSRRPRKKNIHE
jgi:hypothetical protein